MKTISLIILVFSLVTPVFSIIDMYIDRISPELLIVARTGNLKNIDSLLMEKADPFYMGVHEWEGYYTTNYKRSSILRIKESILNSAVQSDSCGAVKKILEAMAFYGTLDDPVFLYTGVRPDDRDKWQKSNGNQIYYEATNGALKNGNQKIVEYLLSFTGFSDTVSGFAEAIDREDTAFIAARISVEKRAGKKFPGDFIPALNYAVEKGCPGSAYLLFKACSPDKFNTYDEYLLAKVGVFKTAVGECDLEIVNAFITENAHGKDSIIIKNSMEIISWGYSPEGYAHCDDSAITRALINAGADVNRINSLGRTPLLMITSHAVFSEALLNDLLAAGADPNIVETSGNTPLFNAVRLHKLKVVGALLAAHADPNAMTLDGQSPLSYARKMGLKTMISLLMKAAAAQNNGNGATPVR
jgi:hypothetical protein